MGTVGPVPSAGLDVTALGLTVTRVVAFPTELLENERTLESKACNSEWTCWANWIKFCVLVTGMSNMSMVRREFIDLFIADMHNNNFFYLGSNNTCVPLQAPDVGPAQTNDKRSTPDSVAHDEVTV